MVACAAATCALAAVRPAVLEAAALLAPLASGAALVTIAASGAAGPVSRAAGRVALAPVAGDTFVFVTTLEATPGKGRPATGGSEAGAARVVVGVAGDAVTVAVVFDLAADDVNAGKGVPTALVAVGAGKKATVPPVTEAVSSAALLMALIVPLALLFLGILRDKSNFAAAVAINAAGLGGRADGPATVS